MAFAKNIIDTGCTKIDVSNILHFWRDEYIFISYKFCGITLQERAAFSNELVANLNKNNIKDTTAENDYKIKRFGTSF